MLLLLFVGLLLLGLVGVFVPSKTARTGDIRLVEVPLGKGVDLIGMLYIFKSPDMHRRVSIEVSWTAELPDKIYVEEAFEFLLRFDVTHIYEGFWMPPQPGPNAGQPTNADTPPPPFAYPDSLEERLQGGGYFEVTMHLAGADVEPSGPNGVTDDGSTRWSVFPTSTGTHTGVLTLTPVRSDGDELFSVAVAPDVAPTFVVQVRNRPLNILKVVLMILGGSLALPKLLEYAGSLVSWIRRRRTAEAIPPRIIVP